MDFLLKNGGYLTAFYLFWLLIYVTLGFQTTLILLAIMINFMLIGKKQ